MNVKRSAANTIVVVICLIVLNSCLSGVRHSVVPMAINEGMFASISNIIPVAIIGSGPAGLSAAVYAARAHRHTVVFHGDKPGGLLTETTWVENWPGSSKIWGPDLIKNLQRQAKKLGAHFSYDTITSIDVSQWPFVLKTDNGETLYALTVIIATGAEPKKLQVPGEDTYWGSGVTACAVCDAPFFKDKEVIVVGGGDSAVEEALQLTNYAKKVTILVRTNQMRAARRMQSLAKKNKKISIEYNVRIDEILGDSQTVTHVAIVDVLHGKRSIRSIDGVFLAIGHEPKSALFKDILSITEGGYVVVKSPTQETSIAGIFAAGDVEDFTYRQAGVAAGSGIRAALDADRFLARHSFIDELERALEHKFFMSQSISRGENIVIIDTLDELKEMVSRMPLLIMYAYADYCPSCIQMEPLIEAVASSYKKNATFIKVDIEGADDIVQEYNIARVPTLLIIHEGHVIARYEHLLTTGELSRIIGNLSIK